MKMKPFTASDIPDIFAEIEVTCASCHRQFTVFKKDVSGDYMCPACKKKKEKDEKREKFISEIMKGENLRESLLKLANEVYDLRNRSSVHVPPQVYRESE
jgi:formate-dependent nitrite reductase cytochrome c552 subunit